MTDIINTEPLFDENGNPVVVVQTPEDKGDVTVITADEAVFI